MKRLLILVFLVQMTACSNSDSSPAQNSNSVTICPRIINGQTCDEAGSPIVEISSLTLQGETACSGTLIEPNKVLTAAHCFVFNTVLAASVSSGDTVVAVSKIATHPNVQINNISSALFNDVAVLTLSRSLSNSTLPLLVSTSPEIGDNIGINGFGLDEIGALGTSKGGAMIISNVTSNHIFADFDGSGANTCNGDSGGPATITLSGGQVAIIGLTSSGIVAECSAGDTTLFTNIQNSSVFDFILQQAPNVGTI